MPERWNPLRAPVSAARRLPERFGLLGLVVDVQRRYTKVHGRYLANAITLATFLSILPLVLVATAVLGFLSGSRPDLADDLVRRLGLRPGSDTATMIENTLRTAESSKAVASIVGLAGLAWTGLGLVAALQYAFSSAWQVTFPGLRGRGAALVWLVGAGLILALSVAATGALGSLPAQLAPLQIGISLAASVGLFLWAGQVLQDVDVGWRALLPGSVVGAAGFQILALLGTVLVPQMVASSSALYGSIGVLFAGFAWFLLFGRVIVYSTVVNVILWERDNGVRHLDVEVPDVPSRRERTSAESSADRPGQ